MRALCEFVLLQAIVAEWLTFLVWPRHSICTLLKVIETIRKDSLRLPTTSIRASHHSPSIFLYVLVVAMICAFAIPAAHA